MFLREIKVLKEKIKKTNVYPFNIPALRNLSSLALNKNVTFFVGENGSGKSTLLEAIAYKCEFNVAGGSANNLYEVASSHADFGEYIRLSWMPKIKNGFFLRAESFYHFASYMDEMAEEEGGRVYDYYGGKSLHEQSHGESFLSLFTHRLGKQGIYLLDEPEAALSPARQLTFLSLIHQLQKDSQLIIATHSPILLGYPNADIFQFDETSIRLVHYEDTSHYQITRRFLENRNFYLHELLDET